jgi:outer membrane protein OmpA-like peptidoglycan-associated protein
MSRTTAIVIAVLLLLLVMWVALQREGPIVEADLSVRVTNELRQAGFSNVRVAADGQELTLTGTVTSTQQRQQALQLADAKWGVTVIHDSLQVLEPATNPPAAGAAALAAATTLYIVTPETAGQELAPLDAAAINAELTVDVGEVVRVGGVVADTAAQQQILQALALQFPNRELLNELSLGADSNPVSEIALPLVPQLLLFERGRLVVANGQVRFTGEVQTFAANAQLRSALAGWGNGDFALMIDVNSPDATEDSCQGLLDDTLSLESIKFATNSADIDPISLPLLNRLASILNTCGFAVQIGGHTDSTGDDVYNQRLSERRAEAVSAYLVSRLGVDSNSAVESPQVRAKGFGESQPIADNTTGSGRRANRRIEFMVRRQQP